MKITLNKINSSLNLTLNKEELEEIFNMNVVSIINLDTLISYSESNPDYEKYLSQLKSYRDEWGA